MIIVHSICTARIYIIIYIYRNYYSNDYQGFIMDGWISEVIQPTWSGDMYF